MSRAPVTLPSCLAFAAVAALASAAADEPTSQPATRPAMVSFPIPAKGSPDWDQEFAWLAPAGLPLDTPAPAVTPYDAKAADRDRYRRGFRVAFVYGVQGLDDPRWTPGGPPKDAYDHGLKDGIVFGRELRDRRLDAAADRDHGFRDAPRGHEVTDRSPADERRVLAEFRAFAAALVREFTAAVGPDVSVEDVGTPRLYAHVYDDYSWDNTGVPRPTRQYKGVLFEDSDGRRRRLGVWPRDRDRPVAAADPLIGSYSFTFDRHPVTGRWVLAREWGEAAFTQYRRERLVRKDGKGGPTPEAEAAVLRAIDRAQEPTGTTRSSTRPSTRTTKP